MMDYCDTEDELKQNPMAKEWMSAIAGDNKAAFDFMWRFWNFTHVFDDVVDADKPIDQELASKAVIKFIECMLFNPFVQQHRLQLFPMMVAALNRWIDATEWAGSDDPVKRAQARVIAAGDVDLMSVVAYLVGGWDHMRHYKGLRTYKPVSTSDKE